MAERYKDYGSILPCGGTGSRLRAISGDAIPKSLFKAGGKELIRYSIDALSPEITNRLVFAVDYKAEEMASWVTAAKLPHIVHFSEQTEPGVLGAIIAGANHVREDSMIACNTDEVRLGLNLAEVVRFHEAQGKMATMVATYSNRLNRHRVLQIRPEDNLVTATQLKPTVYKNHPDEVGLVNTGFLVIDKEAIEQFDAGYSHDWGGIIDPLTESGQLSAYINPKIQYFNVGTPEEYRETDIFLKEYARNGNSS